MTDPGRDGDRVATRSAVQNLDLLSRKTTALARLEAALRGLAAILIYGWDTESSVLAAITLIYNAINDLGAVA